MQPSSRSVLFFGLILVLASRASNGPGQLQARAPLPTGSKTASDRFVAEVLREVQMPELVLTLNDRLVFTSAGMPTIEPRILEAYSTAGADHSRLRPRVEKTRQVLWAISGREAPVDLAAAVKKLREGMNGNLTTLPTSYRAPTNLNEFKNQLVKDARTLARFLSMLIEALEQWQEPDEDADKEPRRWQAQCDLTQACLLLHLAQLFEWQSQLGMMRKDLPDRDPLKHSSWQLTRTATLSGDTEGKKCRSQARKILERMRKEYRGTPWEVLAQRLEEAPIGLRWEGVP